MPAHRSPGGGAARSPGHAPAATPGLQRGHTAFAEPAALFPRLRHWCCTRLRPAGTVAHPHQHHSAGGDGGWSGRVLSCYQSPQAHRDAFAGLARTVASVAQTDTPVERRKVLGACKRLQDCAERHLAGACAPPPFRANNPTTFNAWRCNCWKTRAPSMAVGHPVPGSPKGFQNYLHNLSGATDLMYTAKGQPRS